MFTAALVVSVVLNFLGGWAFFLLFCTIKEEREALSDVQKCRGLVQGRGEKFTAAHWALQMAYTAIDKMEGGLDTLREEYKQARVAAQAAEELANEATGAAIEADRKERLALLERHKSQLRYAKLQQAYHALGEIQVQELKESAECACTEDDDGPTWPDTEEWEDESSLSDLISDAQAAEKLASDAAIAASQQA